MMSARRSPLILGWAEQLEQDSALPDETRQKAGNIRVQSEKLRALIADLNLTSKLQYGAQPLRREMLTAGPLIRRIAAKFCDSAGNLRALARSIRRGRTCSALGGRRPAGKAAGKAAG